MYIYIFICIIIPSCEHLSSRISNDDKIGLKPDVKVNVTNGRKIAVASRFTARERARVGRGDKVGINGWIDMEGKRDGRRGETFR